MAGTSMLADVHPGSFGSNPSYAGTRGPDVFFHADLFGIGRELFVTNA